MEVGDGQARPALAHHAIAAPVVAVADDAVDVEPFLAAGQEFGRHRHRDRRQVAAGAVQAGVEGLIFLKEIGALGLECGRPISLTVQIGAETAIGDRPLHRLAHRPPIGEELGLRLRPPLGGIVEVGEELVRGFVLALAAAAGQIHHGDIESTEKKCSDPQARHVPPLLHLCVLCALCGENLHSSTNSIALAPADSRSRRVAAGSNLGSLASIAIPKRSWLIRRKRSFLKRGW